MTIKEFNAWLEKHNIDENTEITIWFGEEEEARKITEKNLLDCWGVNKVVITDN